MILFISDYLIWHYSRGIFDLFKNIKAMFFLNNHFFAYGNLLRNLFTPLMRLKEEKFDIFSLESILSFLIVNLITRTIGFSLRLVIMVIGLLFLIITVGISIIFIFIWLLLPIIVVYLMIKSMSLMF